MNADARTIGDRGGVATTLDHGVLGIVEVGGRVNGAGRYAVGVWRYDQHQDDIRDLTPDGEPAQSLARGAYALAEGR
ncbi:hypothetical protein ABTJ04_19420, partial [Acinetobacter baumannii]